MLFLHIPMSSENKSARWHEIAKCSKPKTYQREIALRSADATEDDYDIPNQVGRTLSRRFKHRQTGNSTEAQRRQSGCIRSESGQALGEAPKQREYTVLEGGLVGAAFGKRQRLAHAVHKAECAAQTCRCCGVSSASKLFKAGKMKVEALALDLLYCPGIGQPRKSRIS